MIMGLAATWDWPLLAESSRPRGAQEKKGRPQATFLENLAPRGGLEPATK